MSDKLRQTFKQYAASNNIVYKNVINFLKYHGLYDETWDKCCIHKSFDKITFVLLHLYKLQIIVCRNLSKLRQMKIHTVITNVLT